jgi:hypothetical protein
VEEREITERSTDRRKERQKTIIAEDEKRRRREGEWDLLNRKNG